MCFTITDWVRLKSNFSGFCLIWFVTWRQQIFVIINISVSMVISLTLHCCLSRERNYLVYVHYFSRGNSARGQIVSQKSQKVLLLQDLQQNTTRMTQQSWATVTVLNLSEFKHIHHKWIWTYCSLKLKSIIALLAWSKQII